MTDTKVVVDENKQLMKKPQKEDNDDEDAKQFIAKRVSYTEPSCRISKSLRRSSEVLIVTSHNEIIS